MQLCTVPILGLGKNRFFGIFQVATIFYRVPEILQCHSLFRIALSEAVRKWDQVRTITFISDCIEHSCQCVLKFFPIISGKLRKNLTEHVNKIATHGRRKCQWWGAIVIISMRWYLDIKKIMLRQLVGILTLIIQLTATGADVFCSHTTLSISSTARKPPSPSEPFFHFSIRRT